MQFVTELALDFGRWPVLRFEALIVHAERGDVGHAAPRIALRPESAGISPSATS